MAESNVDTQNPECPENEICKNEENGYLKECGFKKSGARWKPKYAFLDNKEDYSERGFM